MIFIEAILCGRLYSFYLNNQSSLLEIFYFVLGIIVQILGLILIALLSE